MIQPPGQSPDPAPAESLAPPRPNLGPEPLEPGAILIQLASVLLIGAFILAALFALWRWRSRHRITSPTKPMIDDSPEARLIALRERARTILAARFGPTVRARTTEELADDARMAEALGNDNLVQLANLLHAGDRALFDRDSATEAGDDQSANLTAWSDMLDSLSRSR